MEPICSPETSIHPIAQINASSPQRLICVVAVLALWPPSAFFFEFPPGDYFHLNIFKKGQKGRFTEVLRRKKKQQQQHRNALALGRKVAEAQAQINKETIAERGDYYIRTYGLFDDASREVNDAVT